jgi:hypothetical protein
VSGISKKLAKDVVKFTGTILILSTGKVLARGVRLLVLMNGILQI